MHTKKLDSLLDPLIQYTCDKFNEITPEKLFVIELLWEKMRLKILDLHNKRSAKIKLSALDYFSSAEFDYHCECLAISRQLLLYIANNPNKYLGKFVEYGERGAA